MKDTFRHSQSRSRVDGEEAARTRTVSPNPFGLRLRLGPDRLVVEITESTLMVDPARARDVVCELDRRGIQISVDDFGTGYSSLAYLRDLPIAELKVDRSFVTGLTPGASAREVALAESALHLGHALGIRVLGEGVEEASTLEALAALGFDGAQGYCLGRPVPPDELLGLLDADVEWCSAFRPRPVKLGASCG